MKSSLLAVLAVLSAIVPAYAHPVPATGVAALGRLEGTWQSSAIFVTTPIPTARTGRRRSRAARTASHR